MKKSTRFLITGSLQPIFFNQFIKEHAEKLNLKGFVRSRGQGDVEIFAEGDSSAVSQMAALCKRGPKHSAIRSVEEKDERFQDFKDFKILGY